MRVKCVCRVTGVIFGLSLAVPIAVTMYKLPLLYMCLHIHYQHIIENEETLPKLLTCSLPCVAAFLLANDITKTCVEGLGDGSVLQGSAGVRFSSDSGPVDDDELGPHNAVTTADGN